MRFVVGLAPYIIWYPAALYMSLALDMKLGVEVRDDMPVVECNDQSTFRVSLVLTLT